MKTIELWYKRTVSQRAIISVEVPDDFPEDDVANVASLLTPQQVDETTADQWNDEEPVVEDGPACVDAFEQDENSKGPVSYRLNESGSFDRT